MKQMSRRVKQLGSCQVEQLSGVGAAIIQDVKMLRKQFRQARQEVDTLEDKLTEMEKKDINVKDSGNREKEDQLILERLGLKPHSMVKVASYFQIAFFSN